METTVTEELNRKVVENLTVLADQYDKGVIGVDGLKTGLRVIYNLTNGLVTEDVAKYMGECRDFMEAELQRSQPQPANLQVYWRQSAEPVVVQHVLDTGILNVVTGFTGEALKNGGANLTGQPAASHLAKQHADTVIERLKQAGYVRVA